MPPPPDIELISSMAEHMLYARAVDEAAGTLQKRGILSLWLSSRGQEAAQVGSVVAAGHDTYIFPSYRDHAAALVRGVSPSELVVQWSGSALCGWDPNSIQFHSYNLVVAAQLLHAVGYALGQRIQGKSVGAVMVYFGDGATSQGDFSEALNLAAVQRLPVLFFCQNNGWALSTSVSDQMESGIAAKAQGMGVSSAAIDGNNVSVVYESTRTAIDLIAETGHPYLIEARTMRMAGHSTSDSPEIYRSAESLREWEQKDPIHSAIRQMQCMSVATDDWLVEVQADIDRYVQSFLSLDFSGSEFPQLGARRPLGGFSGSS
jgi:pyruvate dehydrogenase E1 component alpha subunit